MSQYSYDWLWIMKWNGKICWRKQTFDLQFIIIVIFHTHCLHYLALIVKFVFFHETQGFILVSEHKDFIFCQSELTNMFPFWKQQYFIGLILTPHFLKTFAYEHEPLEDETILSDKFELETLFSWDILKFDLMHNGRKSNVTYVEEHNLLGNVRLYKDSFYLSVPRYLDGVPATLNTIKNSINKTGDSISPILRPFPSLEENLIGDCDSLQNVLALEIDPFGRLWIVDSGNAEIFRAGKSNCSPKIKIYQLCKILISTPWWMNKWSRIKWNKTIIIELISDQDDENPTLLLTHNIPTEVANDKSLLMHIVLEFIEQKGGASPDNASKDVFAFISDMSNGNIVVFDWKKGVSYKKSSVQMRQSVEKFEVLNQQFMPLRSGVRGLALQSQPSLKVHCCNLTNR